MQTHHLRRISGALASCVLLAAGAAQAAKAPKVDICHFDADEGIFKPISVNGNSVSIHIDKHGDQLPGVVGPDGLLLDEDCYAVMQEPDVLARAYIDKNRSGAYEGDTDIDIASVVDTNESGVIDSGDTVEFGQYPTSFDPCPDPAGACVDVGNFTQEPAEIVTSACTSEICEFTLSSSGNVIFFSTSAFEALFTNSADDLITCQVEDGLRDSRDQSTLKFVSGCPGEPASDAPGIADSSEEDDYFLDVDLP